MQLQFSLSSLGVYRNLLKDPVINSLQQLLSSLSADTTSALAITNSYFEFLAHLTKLSTTQEVLRTDLTVWQNYLLATVLFDDNAFTRGAEQGMTTPGLSKAVAFDLINLEELYCIDWLQFKAELGAICDLPTASWPSCNLYSSNQSPTWEAAKPIVTAFHTTAGWDKLVEVLADHYAQSGVGVFGRYLAFKWTGTLEGIAKPDPTTLDNLIGYESQKEQVVENTQQFLLGYPANNLLLYGDRGTGKSATVKALLHRFGKEGLRIIELQKDYLAQLPNLLRALTGHAQKFIIFIDDLSFEEFELEYKALKAVLEGSLEIRPENVLVYATSNRRHLIKELHSDKLPPSDELHHQDTVQEKLSLADRFGQTITYIGPLQYEYLQIVEGLAAQRNLSIDKAELHRLALQWELSHNVRSGRTAKQFIDHLQGQLLLENVSS